MGARLAIFTQSRPVDAKGSLLGVLRLTGASTAWIVGQEDFSADSWDEFVQGHPAASVVTHRSGLAEIAIPSPSASGVTKENVPVETVPSYFQEPWGLMVQFAESPLGTSLYHAVEAGIPESIRGQCIPCAPIIKMGWHDVYGSVEQREGRYYGRSFLTFELDGDSFPNDWTRFRAAIMDLPAIRQLREQLAGVVGQVDQCVI